MKDDIANTKALERAERGRDEIRRRRSGLLDRRRIIHGVPATGTVNMTASEDQTGTVFASMVITPGRGDDVLIDGANNCKIGGDVLVGRLKGAAIRQLSLEERRTCPATCIHWRTCYGNSMHLAKRWRHGPDLEREIRRQVSILLRKRPLLVRLHVLGDFYSLEYLRMWVELLDAHPDLSVFGFTAWAKGTPIGDAVARVRAAMPDQFAIRTSGETGPWGSWTIDWPTEKRFVRINGDAGMVCPEQRDANDTGRRGKHCGNCAACWQSNVPVVFIEH